MKIAAFVALVFVTACGASGDPEPIPARGTGISVSGSASIGVSGSF